MIYRLRHREGFTLSEMLMTVLIMSLVILLLGGGVFVIKNAYDKVTAKAEAQTIVSTAVTKVADEFRYATEIMQGENNEPCSFESGTLNCRIWFKNGDDDESHGGKKGIIICRGTSADDKMQLLTDETMTEGLTPNIEYSYDDAKGVFTATVDVTYKGKNNFVTQTIKIRPVN